MACLFESLFRLITVSFIIYRFTIISSIIHEQSFNTIIRSERHEWIADEPTSLGGQDSGPNPRMLEIAEKYPIHVMLTGDIKVEQDIPMPV